MSDEDKALSAEEIFAKTMQVAVDEGFRGNITFTNCSDCIPPECEYNHDNTEITQTCNTSCIRHTLCYLWRISVCDSLNYVVTLGGSGLRGIFSEGAKSIFPIFSRREI